ncbi:MAG: hypothetical protein PHI72_07130 [Atribacterota bacterium]|jgi:hypothetical protein|nr:hypothetical protein [Atribacterota bacterium]MDD4896124.1 hypothetical protein [Atribacterota bacterium]MDD5637371.1 hypothetical protein [Atribacterota bacterium]
MKKEVRMLVFLFIFFILINIPVYSNEQSNGKSAPAEGWSSIDYFFYKQEQDLMTKKPGSGPIKIGFTEKEVQEVMGVPDRIEEEECIYYYHHSPIYFDTNWKVKSWDNRYGNLKVLPEAEEVKLGYHVWKVFQENDFPLSVKKKGNSYQLDYHDQIIYVNEGWLVEAIQNKKVTGYEKNRSVIDLQDFLQEFEDFLAK